MQYYNRIKDLRIDHDKTQAEIAELLQVPQSYYSKQERNQKPFQVEQIKMLCEYYGVSADYILGLKHGLEWPRKE